MKLGADAMTMDVMANGKFCGACHDGNTAFDTSSFDNCVRCHQK
jgi:c(7)-type cytochrome triheme protein